MMNEICRLCLNKESSQSMSELTKNSRLTQILYKHFLLEVSLNSDLPKQVCTACTIKINDFASFREKIIENEKVLLLKAARFKTQQSYLNETCDIPISDNENLPSDNNEYVCVNISLAAENSQNIIKAEKTNDTIIKIESNEKIKDFQPNLCLMCFKSFSTRNKLFKHYLEKKPDIKLKIESGNIDTQYKSNQEQRCSEHTVSFVCKICGKLFNDAYGILNHGKSHSTERFTCSFKCGYSSGYSHVLKNHEKTHTKEYKYTCVDCGKGFHVKTWYDQHQNIHKGIKDYVCNICGASFHMDRYLTSHKISLHPEVCTKKRYVCMYCSAEFGSKGKFNLHLQDHGIKNEFLCDQCGKVMKDKKRLTAHRLQHSTNRPFVCGKCDKTFAKKYNWKIHLRSHRNDLNEKFECNVCTKTFTQRSALNRHKRSKHKQQIPDAPKTED
ncbi:zinc finger protein OZF-like [Pieris brassicae]|uniref:zinc finger protein OZF-like n=1 Tax=Pieris brassicae TaxID=7116 RepID=UPI001E65E91B|nr:zinc finger protein OZF-like [Pieris brassicae]